MILSLFQVDSLCDERDQCHYNNGPNAKMVSVLANMRLLKYSKETIGIENKVPYTMK